MTLTRKRLLFVGLALCSAAVCVAIFLLTDGSSSGATKTLPDGSVIIVRRITKGTKHRYVSGNVFQRTVGRVLPEAWSKKLGARVANYTSTKDTHVIWLEHSTPKDLGVGAAFAGFDLRISTDAGFDRLYQSVGGLVTPVGELRGFRFDALPTDSRDVQVTVGSNPFDRSSCVTLQVRNPTFVARRQWPAPRCPTSVEQDDVSLHLERFTTVSGRGIRWTDLSYEIRDRAVPTNNWFARRVQIFNEAGFELSPAVRHMEVSLARTNASFQFGVSSAEPYKLRFELGRTSYGPEDQHIFRAVPVPTTNGPPFQPLRAKSQGFTLVLALAPGGAITAQIEPPTNDWRLDPVRVVDDRGRWLLVRGSASSDGRFGGTVALETNSAALDLTFALTRQRTLELIAQPSLSP